MEVTGKEIWARPAVASRQYHWSAAVPGGSNVGAGESLARRGPDKGEVAAAGDGPALRPNRFDGGTVMIYPAGGAPNRYPDTKKRLQHLSAHR